MQRLIENTHLAHGIEKTEYEAKYDENVKALLSDKQVLARIAKYRTEEFKDYEIPDIMDCIEGEATFDVRFYMLTKGKERIKIIVNVEAQKKYYQKYHFEPRAIFYCARMLSEQLDREFTTEN